MRNRPRPIIILFKKITCANQSNIQREKWNKKSINYFRTLHIGQVVEFGLCTEKKSKVGEAKFLIS